MKTIAEWKRVIGIDAAVLDDGRPCAVISFGEEEGPVEQIAINLEDVRQLVVTALAALADHGDDLAREIGESYFIPKK
jgi:hypothetical protein